MKTSLLLIGFLLFIMNVNAQTGIHTIYNPYLLGSKKKSSAVKTNNGLPGNKLSSYIPLADNDSPANRAKNRRTRIIIMPKIDQFYDMIEKEMKGLSK